MPRLKTIVMVPQGAEFNAVQKGLRSHLNGNPETKFLQLVSLPVGPKPVRAFLEQWGGDQGHSTLLKGTHIIVMGLCGSLSKHLKVGDVVLYERCLNGDLSHEAKVLACNIEMPLPSDRRRISSVIPVTGVTCDRVLSSVEDKRQIGQQFNAQVVDMEGFAVLETLAKRVDKISMLRVVSDDNQHNLPDLNAAFDADGNIRSMVMARQFLRHPLGAIRLIRGSLTGLNILAHLSQELALQAQH